MKKFWNDVDAFLKDNILVVCISVGLFIGLVIYYTAVNPIVPWFGCDFAALASPTTWDAGRETPKLTGQIIGFISAFIFYPISGNYIGSIVFAVALFMAAIITALYVFVYRFFKRLVPEKGNKITANLVAFLFIIICFSLFKTDPEGGNMYLFYTFRLTSVFYYVFPAILNSIFVLWLFTRRLDGKSNTFGEMPIALACWLAVAIYFCIFSVLFGGLILVTYCVFEFLPLLIKSIREEKQPFKKFLDSAWLYLTIFAMFIVYWIMEITGGRALYLVKRTVKTSLSVSIHDTFVNFWNLLSDINIMFAVAGVLIIALYLIIRRREISIDILRLAGCFGLIFILYMGAFCISGSAYAASTEFTFGFWFFGILLVLAAGVLLVQKFDKAIIAIPLIVALALPSLFLPYLLSNGRFDYKKPEQTYYIGTTGQQKIVYINEVLADIIAADKEGKDKVTVTYDKTKFTMGNFNDQYEVLLGQALYYQGIISKPMKILINAT